MDEKLKKFGIVRRVEGRGLYNGWSRFWIPVCAGMTEEEMKMRRREDEERRGVFLGKTGVFCNFFLMKDVRLC